MKTTPPPRKNVLEVLPELAGQTTTTIRLHPRRGDVPEVAASKLGGVFLWPDNEPWPSIPSQRPEWWQDYGSSGWKWDFPDGTPIALTPILQINARDVPDFPFPPDKDLLQLLWQSLDVDGRPYFGTPRVYWRSRISVTRPLAAMPLSPHANPWYVPMPCTLNFERITEYPHIEKLSEGQIAHLKAWDVADVFDEKLGIEDGARLYEFELSVSDGNKLGGEVQWIQYPEWQTCDEGHPMEHLLTLTDSDVLANGWRRWLPLEDRALWNDPSQREAIYNAPRWYLGSGCMVYLVCRQCADWPVKAVYER